jgi:hypothetical protein
MPQQSASDLKRFKECSLPSPGTKRRVGESRTGNQVHKHIRNGNTTRAASCMEAAEVAKLTTTTREKFSELHPEAEPTSDIALLKTRPIQISRKTLNKIVKRLATGSATGVSACTCAHKEACTLRPRRMRGNPVAHKCRPCGSFPDWASIIFLFSCRLIQPLKNNGCIRPIAIGGVGMSHVYVCHGRLW